MNKKSQFIYTSDEETRNNLVKFDNSVKLGKIGFTNKLTF